MRNFKILIAKKDDIDYISYGLINRNEIKQTQLSSLNVWFSILSKTVSNYTNKRIDLYSLLNNDFIVTIFSIIILM